MRRTTGILTAVLTVMLLAPVFGDEIVMRNGTTHDVDILATGADFIRVGFQRGETVGEVTVKAGKLDPHSFYSIRNRYMEKSAKNHLDLAKFCVDYGMFTRAQSQADKARAIDNDYVERELKVPGFMEGIAAKVLDDARKFMKKDNLKDAKRYAAAVLNKFGDTPAGKEAADLIDEIERRVKAEDEAAAAKAVEEAKKRDEQAATKALDAFEKHVKPLRNKYERARKMNNDALKEKSTSQSIRMFESAGREFVRLLKEAEKLLKENDDPLVVDRLTTAREQLRNDAVEAYVNAGDRLLARGTYKQALDYANQAIQIDPKNDYPRSLKSRVEMAQAVSRRR